MFSTAQAQVPRYGNQAMQQQLLQQQQMQQMQRMQPIKSVGKLVAADSKQIQLTNGGARR